MIRFVWIIYLPHRGPQFEVRAFIVAMLEMLRRWQWNFRKPSPLIVLASPLNLTGSTQSVSRMNTSETSTSIVSHVMFHCHTHSTRLWMDRMAEIGTGRL